jgi:hypothetical protein
MAGHERKEVHEWDLKGLRVFKKIRTMLRRLHHASCERDRAHNRTLHMDEYMLLLLLYMCHPVIVSLRSLQQASDLKKVRRALGVSRASLGSLSEAARVFDSSLLLGIIGEVANELRPLMADPKLKDVRAVLTLVDGTVLPALPKMAWAIFQKDSKALKAHMQYELIKGVPVAATITDANADERTVLAENLSTGRLYVMDRGYCQYALFQKIMDAGSSLVCRIRDNSVFEVIEERELSHEALDAGVVRDVVVYLGGPEYKQTLRKPLRLVQVECTPHRKPSKTGRGGPEQGDTILIATDRVDLPADVIALIYRYRWQVETFFRSFKHLLGCRHLLSTCENGVELQIYAAILACMLVALYTGRKPNQRTYEMLCWYLMGWATEEELQAHLAKRPRIAVAGAATPASPKTEPALA